MHAVVCNMFDLSYPVLICHIHYVYVLPVCVLCVCNKTTSFPSGSIKEHFTVLYSTLLYWTELYSIVLYYTALYSTVLYSTLFNSTLLHSTLLSTDVFMSVAPHWGSPQGHLTTYPFQEAGSHQLRLLTAVLQLSQEGSEEGEITQRDYTHVCGLTDNVSFKCWSCSLVSRQKCQSSNHTV